jgi:hypothetical protein
MTAYVKSLSCNTQTISIGTKEEKMSKEIIDQVIDQIKEDVGMGDMTAIEELLQNVPEKSMQSYLGEDQ